MTVTIELSDEESRQALADYVQKTNKRTLGRRVVAPSNLTISVSPDGKVKTTATFPNGVEKEHE